MLEKVVMDYPLHNTAVRILNLKATIKKAVDIPERLMVKLCSKNSDLSLEKW